MLPVTFKNLGLMCAVVHRSTSACLPRNKCLKAVLSQFTMHRYLATFRRALIPHQGNGGHSHKVLFNLVRPYTPPRDVGLNEMGLVL